MKHWSLWFMRAFLAGSYLALQISMADSFYSADAWTLVDYVVLTGTTMLWYMAYVLVRMFYGDAYLRSANRSRKDTSEV